jgi:hypothetical protein
MLPVSTYGSLHIVHQSKESSPFNTHSEAHQLTLGAFSQKLLAFSLSYTEISILDYLIYIIMSSKPLAHFRLHPACF